MHTCKNCCIETNTKTKTIIILSCEHQICLHCLVALKKIECPFCNISLLNELPKEITNIIQSNEPIKGHSCAYHDNNTDCDASCFL